MKTHMPVSILVKVLWMLLWAAFVVGTSSSARAAIFSVGDNTDTSDLSPGDGSCATMTGTCTLRAAIQESNNLAGPDLIRFNFTGTPVTITPTTNLDSITDSVIIDATTQPGYTTGNPVVQIDGTGITSNRVGFRISLAAPGTRISGFAMVNFTPAGGPGAAALDNGTAILVQAANCIITANYLGLTTASAAAGNFYGVAVDNVAGTQIGDGTVPGRNIISGNTNGAFITGAGATGTLLRGNFIGLDPGGTTAVANTNGIVVQNNANNSIIGGAATVAGVAPGNVISGNSGSGIVVTASSSATLVSGTTIQGNIIGLNAAGSGTVGSVGNGVRLTNGTTNSLIGTNGDGVDDVKERNIISGNSGVGVLIDQILALDTTANKVFGNYIGTDIGGTLDRGNGRGVEIRGDITANVVGSAGKGNVISGNDDIGVAIGGGAQSNTVAGNFIGTDFTGSADLGNTGDGVFLVGTQFNTIGNAVGSVAAGAGNVIAGNSGSGVSIRTSANGNVVAGNIIGLDKLGDTIRANDGSGVEIINASGTVVGGPNTQDRNIISGNGANGVSISSAVAIATTSNSVSGNYIGTDINGTLDRGNTLDGVSLSGGAQSNTIGGTTTGERNVIAGNTNSGIRISGSAAAPNTTGNAVRGNYLGLQADGATALPNSGAGVLIDNGAQLNTIGGGATAPGAAPGNVISGNALDGIVIEDAGTDSNEVPGNIIGLNAAGTAKVPNGGNGVVIQGGALNNIIGTDADAVNDPNERNIISGNTNNGVSIFGAGTIPNPNRVKGNIIGTNSSSATGLGNLQSGVLLSSGAVGNVIGGVTGGLVALADERNIISGNGANGVLISGVTAGVNTNFNLVANNFIGTNLIGGSALANGVNGVRIDANAQSNDIGTNNDGSRDALEGNLLSGNTNAGVLISGAQSNQVSGNRIGTNLAGTAAVGNQDGVGIQGGAGINVIGGNTPVQRNLISGNAGAGVYIIGTTTSTNSVSGNYIGTNLAGTGRIDNQVGVSIDNGAQSNTIGGITPTPGTSNGNVISGNGLGVNITSLGGGGTKFNVVQGNLVGLAAGGTTVLPNLTRGILIDGATISNTIGGSIANSANVIAGNGTDGIAIASSGTSGNMVQGNFIGTNASLQSTLGNGRNGIVVNSGATANILGGSGATPTADGNTIAFNNTGNTANGGGVVIINAPSDSNPIRGNSIFSNTGLGIDLGADGITNNDNLDPDSGANQNQNFATVSFASFDPNSGQTSGEVQLSSAASSIYLVDIYASAAPDPSGNGEGERWIDQISLTTNGSGLASQTFFVSGIAPGEFVTLTTTFVNAGVESDTSEFSPAASVTGPDVVVNTNDSGPGSLRAAIDFANATTNTTISFNIPSSDPGFNGTVFTIAPLSPLPAVATTGTLIDGYTQPGASANTLATGSDAVLKIQLSGTATNAGATGLSLAGGNGGVRGLIINGFEPAAGSINGAAIVLASKDNTVSGCFLGTNAAGTAAGVTNYRGVFIIGAAATGNTVGGTTPVARNVISGNTGSGILIRDGANANVVAANIIGLSAAATSALANGQSGVSIVGAANNMIGGNTVAERNIISGNAGSGVDIQQTASIGNAVQGNFIGTDAAGTSALSNNGSGVFISAGSNNQIGGIASGRLNRIAFNRIDGVTVAGGTGNTIRGNAIGFNRGLGIDLWPSDPTPNDAGDADSGSNNLQNFPVFTALTNNGSAQLIAGTLNSQPGRDYFIDLYRSTIADQSTFGEGETYVDTVRVTTDANGDATFFFAVNGFTDEFFSATATDVLSGDTSEFSLAQASTQAKLTLTIGQNSINEGASRTATVTRNSPTTADLVVTLASSDAGEATVTDTVTIPAGSVSVTFTINAENDNLVDDNQPVVIRATAPNHQVDTLGIVVRDTDTPTLRLAINKTTISESGGANAATGVVARNTDPSAALTVDLESSDPNEARVPDTLTFEAGRATATFAIAAVDDLLDDGDQTVSIRVAKAGFTGDTKTLTVTDDDAGALRLNITPTAFDEDDGARAARGTLTRNTDVSGPLTVNLSSSDASVQVPATVTIPAGSRSVQFDVAAVDDDIVNGRRTVRVSASAAGGNGPNASATVMVKDDDQAQLTLTISTQSIAENAASPAAIGTIERNAPTASALRVTVQSFPANELRLPKVVTIAAGQKSATFPIVAIDDRIPERSERVTIAALAKGFATARAGVVITDDDSRVLPALTLSVAPSTLFETMSIPARGTVTRRNAPSLKALTVTLRSGDNTEVRLPNTVTIRAGQTSANFPVLAVDDRRDDANQTVTLRATARRFQDGVTTVTVRNQGPALSIRFVPNVLVESAARTAGKGIVRRDLALRRDLTVRLVSNRPNRLRVPNTVTIRAGETEAEFFVDAVDNDAAEDDVAVRVSAAAIGYQSGNATVTVLDDDTVRVRVRPGSVRLRAGQTQRFTADVLGTDDDRVIWSVQEGDAGGTIDQNGLYRAPASAGVFTVVATSRVDRRVRGFARVRVESDATPTPTPEGPQVLHGWGYNEFGQVGDGTTSDKTLPSATEVLSRATQVAANGSHTLALDGQGRVFAWGYNAGGQLGDGSRINRSVPVATREGDGRGQLTGVSAVAAGWYHSLALKEDGSVWAWGLNTEGQLGDGSRQSRLRPTRVRGLRDVVAIAAGTRFSVAVTSDGNVFTWGHNNAGQLGQAAPASRAVPGRVENAERVLSGVSQVSAGDAFVLALRSNGTVISWGENSDGQLGHKGRAPAAMENARNIAAVAAGYAHSLVLNRGGAVFACGNNFYGQLGTGNQTAQSTLQAVGALDNVQSIAAGSGHSMALRRNGTLLAWGYNEGGTLGDGTRANRSRPTRVRGLSDVSIFAAGYGHSIALGTPIVASPPVATQSIAGYSSGVAEAETATITLHFRAPLDGQSTQQPNFAVTQDGRNIAIEEVTFQARDNSVRLQIESGALRSGQHINVRWSGLKTSLGALVADSQSTLTVR